MKNESSTISRKNDQTSKDLTPVYNLAPEKNKTLWREFSSFNEDIKIKKITDHFRQIMLILGLNLDDESLKGTPHRVAKMYVKEMFSGLNPDNEPKITLFENEYQYNEMLVEKNITLQSCCEHHFVPIVGKVHVAYFSSGKLIGLSKINRLVNYYSKRPQLQEKLTTQIAEALKSALETNDVAVVIDAAHMCLTTRGIHDINSKTLTCHYSGKFKNEEVKKEFLNYIKSDQG
ncbi:MAG: GTP cyclohydrolase I FolE [Ginsengibacter sp.]